MGMENVEGMNGRGGEKGQGRDVDG